MENHRFSEVEILLLEQENKQRMAYLLETFP